MWGMWILSCKRLQVSSSILTGTISWLMTAGQQCTCILHVQPVVVKHPSYPLLLIDSLIICMCCFYMSCVRFSASASKWQTDFISHQPQRVYISDKVLNLVSAFKLNWTDSQVKELIRRMKAWRNVAWHGSKEARPKSFLISLLVITAYNRVGVEYRRGGNFKTLASKWVSEHNLGYTAIAFVFLMIFKAILVTPLGVLGKLTVEPRAGGYISESSLC